VSAPLDAPRMGRLSGDGSVAYLVDDDHPFANGPLYLLTPWPWEFRPGDRMMWRGREAVVLHEIGQRSYGAVVGVQYHVHGFVYWAQPDSLTPIPEPKDEAAELREQVEGAINAAYSEWSLRPPSWSGTRRLADDILDLVRRDEP